jgi:hypothetical protein
MTRRSCLGLLLCLGVAPGFALADVIPISKLEIGQVGTLPPAKDGYYLEVASVLSDNEHLIRGVAPRYVTRPFLIKGLPTKGLADGKKVEHPGEFKVTDTRKLSDGRTVFVLEPVKK